MTNNFDQAISKDRERAYRFLDLKNQLRSETDRGAVIVAAALFDEGLKSLLLARLIPSTQRNDELFSSAYAPLSSFSAKIDFSYRIGIIRESVRSSFHLLRKLRNDFAHSASISAFEYPSVQSRLRELFQLNEDILDAILEDITESDAPELVYYHDRIQGKKGWEALVLILKFRGVFDLLVSAITAYLPDLKNEILPLVPLIGHTYAGQ